MSFENICGYRPAPPNFKSWMSPLYEKRFKRLEERQLKLEKLPKLIVLHLFCDDLERLKPWLEIIYELAAPDSYGSKIRFFVDDLWSAYVFQWDGFSIHRGDNSFNVQSPPLIYGVNDAGEVHFFGNAKGPIRPNQESLDRFCSHLLAGSLVSSLGLQERMCVPDVNLSNFNDLIYGNQNRDIVIGFYRSPEVTDICEFFLCLEEFAAQIQHEDLSIYKMNITRSDPPKKFNIRLQSNNALFLLPRDNKHNPLRCYDPNTILKFAAQHSTEELFFFDRHAVRKVHAELLKQMQNFYKENFHEYRF